MVAQAVEQQVEALCVVSANLTHTTISGVVAQLVGASFPVPETKAEGSIPSGAASLRLWVLFPIPVPLVQRLRRGFEDQADRAKRRRCIATGIGAIRKNQRRIQPQFAPVQPDMHWMPAATRLESRQGNVIHSLFGFKDQ